MPCEEDTVAANPCITLLLHHTITLMQWLCESFPTWLYHIFHHYPHPCLFNDKHMPIKCTVLWEHLHAHVRDHKLEQIIQQSMLYFDNIHDSKPLPRLTWLCHPLNMANATGVIRFDLSLLWIQVVCLCSLFSKLMRLQFVWILQIIQLCPKMFSKLEYMKCLPLSNEDSTILTLRVPVAEKYKH